MTNEEKYKLMLAAEKAGKKLLFKQDGTVVEYTGNIPEEEGMTYTYSKPNATPLTK